jgi:hypothetical protein
MVISGTSGRRPKPYRRFSLRVSDMMGEVEQYCSRSSLRSFAREWALDASKKSNHGFAELFDKVHRQGS